MSTLLLIIIIIAAVLVFGAASFWAFMSYVSWRVYQGTLVRTSPEVWGRACSEPENAEQLEMWNRGLAWAEEAGIDTKAVADGVLKETERYTDIRIENDGFQLFGQYIDFGCVKAVIIVPGRCESLMYSYYFAKPYQDAGFNILVIDIRCHGLSSGKYDYVGIGEDSDMICWAKILRERFHNREVWLHGICMGANTSILAATDPASLCSDGSPLFTGLVLEGPYIGFRENFREHLIDGKHPVWPILGMVMNQIKKHTGVDVDQAAPIHYMDRLELPVLILAGEKDVFSIPENTKILFEKCASLKKKLIWFQEGAHSHLRIANESAYDKAIINWVKGRIQMRYINDFREGDNITGIYLCKQKNTAITKNGKEYENLTLADKTGSLNCKIWEPNSMGIGDFSVNDYVEVHGRVSVFNGALQMSIDRAFKAAEGSFDPADYLPVSSKDPVKMVQQLDRYINSVQTPYLRLLLESIFVDDVQLREAFIRHSAAKTIHHGFVGGLLQHTLAVCDLCDFYAQRYSKLNRDLLITAALCHDIGKVRELSPFPLNDYTNEGQLLGHIIIGVEILDEKIRQIKGFPKLRAEELKHCIVSHHGEYEFGSPKKPAIIEAVALNFADNTDAKLQAMTELLENNSNPDPANPWMGYSRIFDSNVRPTD